LVGCVLAIHLVRRGLDVTVYERAPDLRHRTPGRAPALSLSLCTRGTASLTRLGLMDRLGPLLAPAFGRMIHAPNGDADYQPYSVFGEAIHCVSRRELGIALLNAAEAAGVEIVFERRLVDMDVSTGSIIVEDIDGRRARDRGNAVFGADGVHSTVRSHLARDGWCEASHVAADESYVAFRIDVDGAARTGLRFDALHGWPRPEMIAGAFPEAGGSFSGTLHTPLPRPAASVQGSHQPTLAAVVERECPDLASAAPDLAEQLAAQRPNRPGTVRCRPWSAAGRVLLVGDAAHAMLPYYGQGANAGFEDCAILDSLIDRYGTDWEPVFEAFEGGRRPDTDAMADLCQEHLAILRDDSSRPEFQRQWRFEQQLHRLMPDTFMPLYSMIAFSSLSYAEARRRDRLQEQLVRELLEDGNVVRQLANPALARAESRRIRARLNQIFDSSVAAGPGTRRGGRATSP